MCIPFLSFQCASDGWRTSYWNMSLSLVSETKVLICCWAVEREMEPLIEIIEEGKVCACGDLHVCSACVHAVCKNHGSSALSPRDRYHCWSAHRQPNTHTNTNIHTLYWAVFCMHVSMYMLLPLTTEWKLMFLNVKASLQILPSSMSNITCSAQNQLL